MSNEQKSPILPKKYEGVTPGPWAISEKAEEEVIDGIGEIIADCWPLDSARVKVSGEAFANAKMITDAPRLAAAVVVARKLAWHIANIYEREQVEGRFFDGKTWLTIAHDEGQAAREFLESTKEWEA